MERRSGKLEPAVTLMPKHASPGEDTVQVLIGSPTLGLVRIEWYNAMQGMVCPPNWAVVRSTPCGFKVPDAQNILCDTVLRGKFRAVLLIEDDTCPPAETLIQFDRWFWKAERRKAPPVVSGLYHIKGSAESRPGKRGGVELLGAEPLIYRGSGQRAHRDWTPGDVVWCSGVPTGALLIHRSVLEAWAAEPDVETYSLLGYPYQLKRIFQQPSHVWRDPEGGTHVSSGTSDLWWSEQTIRRGILQRAGWADYYKRPRVRRETADGKWPFVVDTSLRFGHVDRHTGAVY